MGQYDDKQDGAPPTYALYRYWQRSRRIFDEYTDLSNLPADERLLLT